MKPASPIWTSVLLLGAAALALAFTAYTLGQAPGLRQQIARRQADLVRLQTLAGEQAVDRAALDALAAAGAGAPALPDLIKSVLPGTKVDLHERETQRLIEGWSVRLMDVMLDDVNLAEAGQLLLRLEAARPPWRVAELQITASEGSAGRGRVTLLTEGLQRAGTTP